MLAKFLVDPSLGDWGAFSDRANALCLAINSHKRIHMQSFHLSFTLRASVPDRSSRRIKT